MTSVRRGAPDAEALTVNHGGISYDVEPEARLTFGRGVDCVIRLGRQADGEYDPRLSRDAGYFEPIGPLWFVWATGNDLDLHDDLGGVTPVLRGTAAAIGRPHMTVILRGSQLYELDVRYPERALPSSVSLLPRRFDERPTEKSPDPVPSRRQKVVYVAKLSPMLEGTGGARSLRATAAFLRAAGDREYTDDAVRNLWAAWVAKCVGAGFPGLTRETGLDDLSADRAMFRELRKRGLLRHEDLKLLPGAHQE